MKRCGFNIGKPFFYTSILIVACYVILLYQYDIVFNNEWLPSYFSSFSSTNNHDKRSDNEDGSLLLNVPLSNFDQHWIDWNKWRFDYKRFQMACGDFTWMKSEGVPWFELANHTDPTRGVVQEMEIRRAGEFSRFVLRSQNSKG